MNHLPKGLPTGLATAALLGGAIFLAVLPGMAAEATATPVQFGMTAASFEAQTAAGVKPDYGTFWIGPWTLKSGWGGPDGQLTTLKNAGITPAIHFYYWGDDISPSCVENGCWSNLHSAQKERAQWDVLSTQLTDHLNAKMGGAPVVIFLESEFNKGGIETYEPFDGYMAAMADKIHAAYPNAIIVLGFGNWGSNHWSTFDRAAAASDMVGIQGMRGSTRQTQAEMMTLYDELLSGVLTLESKFPGTPIMLTDIAVSSYPEPEYVNIQRDAIKEVFDNLDVLKSHGVEALIYRAWQDTPNMDLANYYGMAERYWGLTNADGPKPSAQVWIDGVKAERAGSTTTSTSATGSTTTTSSTTTTASPYKATFTTNPASNEYWVQEKVTSSPAATKVSIQVNGGEFKPLKLESYGDWTASMHIAKGTPVVFRATAPDGQTSTSPAQNWLGGSTSTTTTSSTPAPAPYKATFTTNPASNEYWVQEKVTSTPAAAKVSIQVNGGEFKALKLESYGEWTAPMHIVKGTPVVFRATAPDGQTVTSPTQNWLGVSTSTSTSTTTTSSTPAPAPYKATFTTNPASNEYWVQEKVTSSPAATKVSIQVNGGAWHALKHESYGDWTASIHIAKGTPVVFRATAPDGQTVTSSAQNWLGTATTSSSTPTTAPAFKATFTPKNVGNDWWVETAVSGNAPIAKVEAKVNSGSWIALPASDWGTYAKSIQAPNGSQVTFLATSATGATSTSSPVIWI